MPINIGKNLKIQSTNDTKVSRFVRNYKQIHDYIDEHCSRHVVYYAYIYPYPRYVDTFEEPYRDSVSIAYSTKELTSTSGETTGAVQFFYKINGLDEGYQQIGTGIMTSVSEVEASKTYTGNISEFYSNGFKDWKYKAIRCPNLDIYNDGTVGNGDPYMYAYSGKDQDTGDWLGFIFFPLELNNISDYSLLSLFEYTRNEISLNAFDTYGSWIGDYETMVELPDGTFYTYLGCPEILTRDPEHDLTDIGVPSQSPLKLYDLLMSLIPTAVIEYSGLPTGATFVWKIGNETLTNPATVKEGQIVEYTLTYSNGSKCVDSFTVTGDVALDLSELEANKFNLTITANKTLSTVRVYHNWSSGSTNYEDITTFTNNTAVVECNKNENVRVYASSDGWSQIAQTPDFMNLSLNPHDYSNITQNISETYNFTYESYSTQRIYLKDDNDNYIDMSSTYLNYIIWNPSDSTKFVSNGIIFDGSNPDYYNSYKDKSISVDYTINVPGYAQITGTFGSTVSPSRDNQTKTLVPMCTFTLTPIPSTATVTLQASGYTTVSGVGPQSITVAKNTTVYWMITKEDYEPGSGSTQVTINPQGQTEEIFESAKYKVNVDDYEYTKTGNDLVLDNYIGSNTAVVAPTLEED